MPIYDFFCPECDEIKSDLWAKMSETEKPCPDCEAEMSRKMSAPVFKMGKSCFVKKPDAAEQKASEWIMNDYKERQKGNIQ